MCSSERHWDFAASQAASRALFSLDEEPGRGMGCVKIRPLEQVHEQEVSGVGSVQVIEGVAPRESIDVSIKNSLPPFIERRRVEEFTILTGYQVTV